MKPRPDLVPAAALLSVAAVMAHGAEKHGARAFEAGRPWSGDYAALLRHLWLWWTGAPPDAESGQSHLAHAVARGLILLGMELAGRPGDDREREIA